MYIYDGKRLEEVIRSGSPPYDIVNRTVLFVAPKKSVPAQKSGMAHLVGSSCKDSHHAAKPLHFGKLVWKKVAPPPKAEKPEPKPYPLSPEKAQYLAELANLKISLCVIQATLDGFMGQPMTAEDLKKSQALVDQKWKIAAEIQKLNDAHKSGS